MPVAESRVCEPAEPASRVCDEDEAPIDAGIDHMIPAGIGDDS